MERPEQANTYRVKHMLQFSEKGSAVTGGGPDASGVRAGDPEASGSPSASGGFPDSGLQERVQADSDLQTRGPADSGAPPAGENPEYLSSQLITYLGNKRALLDFIGKGVELVKKDSGKNKLRCFDVFSGSGIVSRYLKQHSSFLAANDLEPYAKVLNRCYLANKNEIPLNEIKISHKKLCGNLAKEDWKAGFISRLYAPKNDLDIKRGERVFYTRRNALYLDTASRLIHSIDENLRPFFLAPLLSEASIHVNTAGLFKGFYKCRETGIGKFGGTGGHALSRIQGNISLPFPVLSNFNCETCILCGDSNTVIKDVPEVDLAYLDPPYNQHPYGSNYFMLNLLANYTEPEDISRVSGIPKGWNRSNYNKQAGSFEAFSSLAAGLKARYLLISFNSEGFISYNRMMNFLNKLGRVWVLEKTYNTFRGSRNLRNRNVHVKEFLYLVRKN